MDVFIEDQNHVRTRDGGDAGRWFTRVAAVAPPSSLLSGIDRYGDTMFNIAQLRKIEAELTELAAGHPELAEDFAGLRALFEKVERARGYVWIAGD